MIRAVIDTNLIVSYLLTQSETTSRLVDHWELGHFAYLISPQGVTMIRAYDFVRLLDSVATP